MGKHRIARCVRAAVLVAAVLTLVLVAWVPGAGATAVPDVTPIIDHACPSGTDLTTVWGYNNTSASAVTINLPDSNDDNPPAIDEGGDNDDNFFFPLPVDRSQPTVFQPVTVHAAATTTAAPGLLWNTGANSLASNLPVNCADLAVTKTQAINTVTTGSLQEYDITVTNNGPTPAENVALSDVLTSSAVSGVTATPSVGTCTVAVPNITCNSLGTLNSGQSATVTVKLTPTGTGSIGDTATGSSTTFDPDNTNNSASVTTTVAAAGGSTGGGILNTGQQLTVNGTGTTGTVKVKTGTVPLTLGIEQTCPVGAVCKSQVLDIEPHATPAGQTLTAVFDTGRPSPFVFIPFVKFLIFKDGVDKPLPFCRPYLKPQPLPDGSACEYFRWTNLQGHAIVYIALGANDPRVHR